MRLPSMARVHQSARAFSSSEPAAGAPFSDAPASLSSSSSSSPAFAPSSAPSTSAFATAAAATDATTTTEQRLADAERAADAEIPAMTSEDTLRYRQSIEGDDESGAASDAASDALDAAHESGTLPVAPEVEALMQRLRRTAEAARSDPNATLIVNHPSAVERAWLEQLRIDVESLRRFGVAPRTGRGVRVESGEIYFTFKAFDKTLLRQFTERLAQKALALQLDCFSVVPLPTRIRKWTVLASPFIDKKARSQFEMRVHKRLVVVQTRGLERRLHSDRFDHWAAQARVHRLIEIFMRFMPGIQVTFHQKIHRRV
jgi:ribosomal protein S10